MSGDDADSLLEDLTDEECWQLVSSLSIGRVAIGRVDRPPLVVPVNYVVDDRVIVFRTGAGQKLEALRQAAISFQVDVVDPVHHRGWSVLIGGPAHEASHAEVDHLHLESWAKGPKQHWIRLAPTELSGRRIRLVPEAPTSDDGYL
jgi:nitroimidazol reductase NimA-like FMN-containing flavoprotein (pyridoxamine 5'-phosphate oxidase superfamily)